MCAEKKLKSITPNFGQSKFRFNYWKQRWLDKARASKCIVINMELLNGMHKTFLVSLVYQGFSFQGGRYIFDDELKYYNVDFKNYCFDYHQGMAMPIKRKIPLNTLQKVIDSSGLSEVEYATNPQTLERFIVAKIAEGIMKGQQITEELKAMKLAIYIAAAASVLHFLTFVIKSGMLQQIKIPGLG